MAARGRRAKHLLRWGGFALLAAGLVLVAAGPGAVARAEAGDANLSLTQADSPDPVLGGANLTYTVTVENAGPDPAASVVVSDPLPTGVVFVSADASQGTCTETAGTVDCDLGSLANAASATVTIVVRPSAAGMLSNTATVSSATADPDPSDNADTETTEVSPAADLSLAKADSPDPVAVGGNLTYTSTVANAGPSGAAAVTVSDPLPAGVVFVSANASQGTCTETAGTVDCALGSLASAASATVTIVVRPSAAGTLSNTATVSSPTADPDPSDDSDTETTEVASSADLSLTKTDSPGTAFAAEDLTYTLTVANAGPSSAAVVAVSDPLPAGAAFVSANASQGSCTETAGTVDCALGSMANGASATVTIVVRPSAAGTLSNTATVSASTNDPDPSDNSDTETTEVGPAADLSVTKADSPDPVLVGGNLTYTLTVANAGPSSAAAVTVSDPLPAGVVFVSANASQGTCAYTAGTVDCALGALANEASATVTIVVRPTAAGTLSNTVTVGSATADPESADNSDTETTEVAGAADLSLAKADSPDPVFAAEDLTYTLTVANAGPSAAAGVTVSDPLPLGVTFVSASASQGTCTHTAGTVACALGALANGASATVTIVVRPTAAGTLSNTATVSSTTADPDPTDNADTESTTVSTARPNIVVVMTDDQAALDGRLIPFQPTVKSIFVDAGVTFSDFHSETPLCCPARAGYLSGQHTHNHGVDVNQAKKFKPAMSVATQLRGVGYHTVLVGKYMNAYEKCSGVNCAPNVPPGWNRWTAMAKPNYYKYNLWLDGNPTPEFHGSAPEDYSTDVLSARAVQHIHLTPTGKPLFLWVAPYAPHSPGNAAPRHKNAPCDVATWTPPSWNEADVSDKPAYVRNTPLRNGPNALKPACRTLLAVDDLVRSVRDGLAAAGRLQNTLFVYAGDNGMNIGEHRLADKSAPYQTQVPFYLSWPARLGTSPRSISERLHNIDLAPTLCELASCTLGPYPNGQTTPDGRSFAQVLLGAASHVGRDALLDELTRGSNGIPAWSAVTTTEFSNLATQGCAAAPVGGCRWHYIEYPSTGEKELYDISNGPCWTWTVGAPGDPCELDNAIANPAYADIVTQLAARLAQLRAEKGQP